MLGIQKAGQQEHLLTEEEANEELNLISRAHNESEISGLT
jgi:hypothetical protein